MNRFWSLGILGLLVSLGSIGCVPLEKYQALERANRVLEEELARAKDDLLEKESLLSQKDTKISALESQLATQGRLVDSLTAENSDLKKRLDDAQKLLEKYAGQQPKVHIVERPMLPAPVDAALKKLQEEYPEMLEYDPKKGAVRWKADLLFPLGSDQLATAGNVQEALAKFAKIISAPEVANFDVIVVGHTCTTRIAKPETLREHKTNWHLSAHRAISVMNLLADKAVSMDRMGVMGYGEHRPIADNSTEAGKAKNRRVEVYLVPRDSVQSVGMGVSTVNDMGLAYLRATDK